MLVILYVNESNNPHTGQTNNYLLKWHFLFAECPDVENYQLTATSRQTHFENLLNASYVGTVGQFVMLSSFTFFIGTAFDLARLDD